MMQKPGWKTSEFWLTTIPVVLGAVAASGILDDTATPWDNKLVGLAISVLAALGYGAMRTVAKTKSSKAEQ
ncbi:MAG: hypothetical protein AMJ46_12690 [Latescibacteria bacterium DG_63]|nr:MAG: hypothetical protein AMJ46_12690 [Latescibacteria bacterium DG_63]